MHSFLLASPQFSVCYKIPANVNLYVYSECKQLMATAFFLLLFLHFLILHVESLSLLRRTFLLAEVPSRCSAVSSLIGFFNCCNRGKKQEERGIKRGIASHLDGDLQSVLESSTQQ